jgi:hypothetical protein
VAAQGWKETEEKHRRGERKTNRSEKYRDSREIEIKHSRMGEGRKERLIEEIARRVIKGEKQKRRDA